MAARRCILKSGVASAGSSKAHKIENLFHGSEHGLHALSSR